MFFKKDVLRVSFLTKLQASAFNFIKKETLAQVFSCEFCEISNTFSYRTPPVATSEKYSQFVWVPEVCQTIFRWCLIPQTLMFPSTFISILFSLSFSPFFPLLSPLWFYFPQKLHLISSIHTPCPSPPAWSDPVASPVDKLAEIASPVPNYASHPINE